jgi:hypothetical protein
VPAPETGGDGFRPVPAECATSKKSTDADSGSDSKKEKSSSQSGKSSNPEPESGSALAAVDNDVVPVAQPVAKIGMRSPPSVTSSEPVGTHQGRSTTH